MSPSDDNTLRILETSAVINGRVPEHSGTIKHIEFSPDGRELISFASGSPRIFGEGEINLWDAEKCSLIKTLDKFEGGPQGGDRIQACGYAENGKEIFSSGTTRDGGERLRLFDSATHEEISASGRFDKGEFLRLTRWPSPASRTGGSCTSTIGLSRSTATRVPRRSAAPRSSSDCSPNRSTAQTSGPFSKTRATCTSSTPR